MAASKPMASPAFLLLLIAMALMLAASALAQGPASPAPSQGFCPPNFNSLQSYEMAAKTPGYQSLYVYVPELGTSASVTSMMAGILSQYPSTWQVCLCTPNPLFIIRGSPEVICAYYYGSVTV